jgi:hypothetical protein
MFLYKYLKQDGIDLIKNLRLLANNAIDSNDPFEHFPSIAESSAEEIKKCYLDKEYARYLYETGVIEGKILGTFNECYGRLQNMDLNSNNFRKTLYKVAQDSRQKFKNLLLGSSFCADSIRAEDDILMWAHYADNNGMRITFDVDVLNLSDKELVRIEYSQNRALINPLLYLMGRHDEFKRQYEKVLRIKSHSWQYEKEYRWLIKPSLCFGRDKKYINIPNKSIVAVDLGIFSKKGFTRQVVKILSKSKMQHVKLRKTVLDEHQFKLNYELV